MVSTKDLIDAKRVEYQLRNNPIYAGTGAFIMLMVLLGGGYIVANISYGRQFDGSEPFIVFGISLLLGLFRYFRVRHNFLLFKKE